MARRKRIRKSKAPAPAPAPAINYTSAPYALALPELVHEILSWVFLLMRQKLTDHNRYDLWRWKKKKIYEYYQERNDLSNCSQVNHLWYTLAMPFFFKDSTALNLPDIFQRSCMIISPNRVFIASLVKSARIHTSFRRHNYPSSVYATDTISCERVLRGLTFSKLRSLEISPSHIITCVPRMKLECPVLSRITIKDRYSSTCFSRYYLLPEVWLTLFKRILSMAKNVEYIFVPHFMFVTHQALEYVVRHAPHLKELKHGDQVFAKPIAN